MRLKKGLFTLFLIPVILFADWDNLFFGEGDPFTNHHVNISTGNLNLAFHDEVTRGPEPFAVLRTYSSGGGWSTFPEISLEVTVERDGVFLRAEKAIAHEPSGHEVHYVEREKKLSTHNLILMPEEPKFCYYGSLSSRENPSNNRIEIDPRTGNAILYLPNGGRRIYKGKKVSDFSFTLSKTLHYKLEKEVLPSKHVRLFKYSKKGDLKRVDLTNPKGTKIYSTISFDYEGADSPMNQVKCADGKNISYRFRDGNKRIAKVSDLSSSCVQEYEYTNIDLFRFKSTPQMKSVQINKKAPMLIDYYRKGDDYGKVRQVISPVGEGGGLLPVATFEYPVSAVEVRDVNKVLTKYGTTQAGRVNAILYFNAKEQLYAVENYNYGGAGEFVGKVLKNREEGFYRSKGFLYNKLYDVTEESYTGDLRGLGSRETLRNHYTYDEASRLIKQIDYEEGVSHHFTYFADTDFIYSKVIKDGERVLRREFFLYDEDHILVAEIEDNGTGCDPYDLTRVTRRRLKRYEIDERSGLVKAMNQLYADPSSGQEFLILRTEYTYSRKNIIREEVFDSEGKRLYAISTDYDDARRIVRKSNAIGQENTYAYDRSGNLIESKEVGSLRQRFSYNAMNLPLSIKIIDDEGGEQTSTTKYDRKGRVKQTIDADQKATDYEYDDFGRCIKTSLPAVQDEKGETYRPTVTATHDVVGNITSETDSSGRVTRTAYNAFNAPTKITFPDGSVIRHVYKKTGVKDYTIHQDGSKTSYVHDIEKRLVQQNSYDKKGNLLGVEEWTYDSFDVIRHKTPDGLVTEYEYNLQGQLIQEKVGERIKSYTYDALGNVRSVEEGGVAHVQIHDAIGRILQEWDEEKSGRRENELEYIYDESNRKTKVKKKTSCGEAVDSLTYDARGRIVQHEDPKGNITKFAYGDKGFEKVTIDAHGNKTKEIEDVLKRPISKIRTDSKDRTVFEEAIFYDKAGRKKRVETTLYTGSTKGKKTSISWEHDQMGRIVKQIEPEGKVTTYSYDVNGNLLEKRFPSGLVLTNVYDALGRLVRFTSSDQTIDYSYTYKGCSPLPLRYSDPHISIDRTYNEYGQITSEVVGNKVYKWTYDKHGRKETFTLPDNTAIAYAYSGLHMIEVKRLDKDRSVLYAHQYDHFDPNGHVDKETLINGHLALSKRDLLERPVESVTPHHKQTRLYNSLGLVLEKTSSLFGKKEYDYDPLQQLIKEGEKTYEFDSLGNETANKTNDLNQIIETPDCAITYDLNGNPTTRTYEDRVVHYTYDALNRLTSVTIPEEKRVVYTYDPLSRLTSKKVYQAIFGHMCLTQYEKFLYDQESEIGTEDPDGDIIELKILGLGLAGDIGGAVALELHGEVYTPLHDFNGNIIALISLADNAVTESYDIDAFGKGEEGDYLNPWRFSSKRSEEFSLIYFGFRFYDTELHRWLTPDPAGFQDGANLYAFVLNSPVNRFDSLGLQSKETRIRSWPAGYTAEQRRNTLPSYDSANDHRNPYVPSYCPAPRAPEPTAAIYIMKAERHDIPMVVSHQTAEKMGLGPPGSQVTVEQFHSGILRFAEDHGSEAPIIFFHNGIYNTSFEQRQNIDTLHKTFGADACIFGFYNESNGAASDLNRALKTRSALTLPDDKRRQSLPKQVDQCGIVLNMCADAIYKHDVKNPFLYVAHSEGSAQLHHALLNLSQTTLDRLTPQLHIVTVGALSPIPNVFGKTVVNYYSENDQATLRFGRKFMNNTKYNIQILDCATKSRDQGGLFVGDHFFQGETYQKAIRDHYRDNFGSNRR